ncbi:Txe/YoeB family addiction module toxin [Campylobacter ureolyticus]|uniref:Txe/YoeB family addiction module toxin n=1 Tax=Campylobacter ureolyticus TaxID=827 RepID=UPI0022B41878|nr:Txe/YoeB family addiction module toxin [Campylobacter ureolyticus]MCZ6155675.1 Txe/YoeB family addiction module toxin [Campylobacter ureolyticus]
MLKAFTDDAWEEFCYWQKKDKKVFKRIIDLIKDIDRNQYNGIGKPERLSGNLSAYYSRRIDSKNRIVYKIENEIIKIIQCGSHYKDK